MARTPAERRLAAQIAANESWARTEDRAARTSKARAALEAKFLEAAGGDPVKAEHIRRAHYQRISLASLRARRLIKEGR